MFRISIAALTLFGAVLTQAAFALPVLSITASPSPAIVGNAVSVDVSIAGVTDLYAYQFTLLFDPTLFQATGATEGPFLATGGTTFFDGGTIDNSLGSISFVFDTLLVPVQGVSGSGGLASFSFNAISSGTGMLSFVDALFLDSNLNELAGLQADGLALSVVPESSAYWLLAIGLAALTVSRHRIIKPRRQHHH